jgi:carbon-monoxide dehydrogenase medium subunit
VHASRLFMLRRAQHAVEVQATVLLNSQREISTTLRFAAALSARRITLKAPAFEYVKAASLPEACQWLERYGDDAKLLAGGQSLMPALNMRLSAPRLLVDINGIAALEGISVSDGRVRIAALTRHREVERSREIAEHLPLLHKAMPHVAHAAVRNRGTVGGSIAFADPAAELPACSVALGATFLLASRSGERRVAAREFFRGLYETALEPGEVLSAAEFPVLAKGYRSVFLELARRHGDYAIVGIAAHAQVDGDALSDVRLVYFGVGPAPFAAAEAAAVLERGGATDTTIAQAQAALGRELDPFGDVHHSSAARLHLARVLLGRVVRELTGKQSDE